MTDQNISPELQAFFESEDVSFFNAYMATDGNWYCLDHFCSEVLGNDTTKLEQFSQNILNEDILATPELVRTINENTVQYEQYPGESIPLDGVYCSHCNAELYTPMEEE